MVQPDRLAPDSGVRITRRTSHANFGIKRSTSNFMMRLLASEFLHKLPAQLTGIAKSAALALRRRLAQTPPATRL